MLSLLFIIEVVDRIPQLARHGLNDFLNELLLADPVRRKFRNIGDIESASAKGCADGETQAHAGPRLSTAPDIGSDFAHPPVHTWRAPRAYSDCKVKF